MLPHRAGICCEISYLRGVSQRVSNETVKVYTAAGKISDNLALTVAAGCTDSDTQCNKGLYKKVE